MTALAVAISAHVMEKEPLIIADQGSFAVGGLVVTSEGKYDPKPEITQQKSNKFWDEYNASLKAGGQTLHGDHAVGKQAEAPCLKTLPPHQTTNSGSPNSVSANIRISTKACSSHKMPLRKNNFSAPSRPTLAHLM
ncbi:hypothetical protein ROV45_02795 [Pasteurella multocida]|nr:hypothetical protein [Pasteurella multocida]MEB3490070.1 hypothetical protein [Pasteurella multocida]MEB3501208.1 hypothetical protein [Pasteurella multocida]